MQKIASFFNTVNSLDIAAQILLEKQNSNWVSSFFFLLVYVGSSLLPVYKEVQRIGLLDNVTQQGTPETVHLRLGLEPTCWDSYLGKTLRGTPTHHHLIEITDLLSGLTEARCFVSHRRNSTRGKVIDKI